MEAAANAVETSTPVGEVMTTSLATVGPHEGVDFAHRMMLWRGVRHLPVVDGGVLVGILSDRDLLPALAHAPKVTTGDVMTKEVETAKPDEDLGVASARMALKRIDCLPVLDDQGLLIGIVTTTDVLAARGRLFFKGGRVGVPTVKQVMHAPAIVVRADDDLLDAVGTLTEQRIRHLPVVDGDGQVVGMLSDRDVRAALGDPLTALGEAGQRLKGRVVADAMASTPATVRVDTSLTDLASYLLDDRIGALPVVDDADTVVGIVSYVDLLAHAVATR